MKSKSRIGVLLGISIIAIAVISGLWVSIASKKERAYPEYKDASGQVPQGTPSTASPSIEKSVEKRPCENPQGHDESDLCAQWTAAYAAEESAKWAYWQFILSIAGVFGLGLTLLFNQRALRLANESQNGAAAALAIAERNAIAAERAVEISAQTTQVQIRAYVSVIPTSLENFRPNGLARIKFSVKNCGASPALKFHAYGRIEVTASALPVDFNFTEPDPADVGGAVIFPGQSTTGLCFSHLPLTAEDFPLVITGQKNLCVHGSIGYEDIFGKAHKTTFCYLVGGPALGKAQGQLAHTGALIESEDIFISTDVHNHAD